jgi:hypothetical protein
VVIREVNSEAGSSEFEELTVRNSHGKFVVEEELEVSL